MNCPICLSIIQNSCVPSCSHHFCYECLINWIKNNGINCPLCNQFISEIKIDTEFDNLQRQILQYTKISNHNNNNDNNDNNYDNLFISNKNLNHKEIIILLDNINSNTDKIPKKNDDIGITIKNNKGPGVKVISLKKDKLAFQKGIKVNDIILFINNIPCINHKQSIDIIYSLVLSRKIIKFTLL